jgi:hypothetical protein
MVERRVFEVQHAQRARRAGGLRSHAAKYGAGRAACAQPRRPTPEAAKWRRTRPVIGLKPGAAAPKMPAAPHASPAGLDSTLNPEDRQTMEQPRAYEPAAGPRLPLDAAAELQDHLLSACHDLERLQALLAQACDTLHASFLGAHDQTGTLGAALPASPALAALRGQLSKAITALQFQDMAAQLVAHTQRRLRGCADGLARDAMGDEDGEAVVEALPQRPNPVTQDEMDAGSIELF